jgi:hypothetical protein
MLLLDKTRRKNILLKNITKRKNVYKDEPIRGGRRGVSLIWFLVSLIPPFKGGVGGCLVVG